MIRRIVHVAVWSAAGDRALLPGLKVGKQGGHRGDDLAGLGKVLVYVVGGQLGAVQAGIVRVVTGAPQPAERPHDRAGGAHLPVMRFPTVAGIGLDRLILFLLVFVGVLFLLRKFTLKMEKDCTNVWSPCSSASFVNQVVADRTAKERTTGLV